jgi:hypothetical protein
MPSCRPHRRQHRILLPCALFPVQHKQAAQEAFGQQRQMFRERVEGDGPVTQESTVTSSPVFRLGYCLSPQNPACNGEDGQKCKQIPPVRAQRLTLSLFCQSSSLCAVRVLQSLARSYGVWALVIFPSHSKGKGRACNCTCRSARAHSRGRHCLLPPYRVCSSSTFALLLLNCTLFRNPFSFG